MPFSTPRRGEPNSRRKHNGTTITSTDGDWSKATTLSMDCCTTNLIRRLAQQKGIRGIPLAPCSSTSLMAARTHRQKTLIQTVATRKNRRRTRENERTLAQRCWRRPSGCGADNHLQPVLGVAKAKTQRGLGIQTLPREYGSHRDHWDSRGVLF